MSEPVTESGRRLWTSWQRFHDFVAREVGESVPGVDAVHGSILAIEREAAALAGPGADRLDDALEILDMIDGIVDDTHPEGDGCPLCVLLDDLRAALSRSETT